MLQRIDRLAELGATIITQSGGEPLLHPELDDLIRRVRKNGALAGMITNGYLLTRERIERLNRAGLEHLQISIDNAMPDETSKKSLKVLDQKLVLLSEYAEFQVNINSVLGCGIRFPEDALKVARRALELGFTSTRGVLPFGRALPLYLRGWIGALVLAAARLSGYSADAVQARRFSPRIQHCQTLRASLYRLVLAAGGDAG